MLLNRFAAAWECYGLWNGCVVVMERGFKYLLPIDKTQKTGVFALTPWCFYMHGIKGAFELPKHMYTSFTLVLNQGERLIIVPDDRFREIFINGKFAENGEGNGAEECKFISQDEKIASSTKAYLTTTRINVNMY